MEKILFVCLGNICRSPLAEAIFKHKVAERKLLEHFYVESCGTANYHIGDTPDPRTIRNALKNGVKIDHLGRQLCVEDFDKFDRIFVMDSSNLANARRLAEQHHHSKISMFREFDTHGVGEDVPDPYYGEEKDFQLVFDILSRSVDAFLDKKFTVKKQSLNS